ncbi:MAG: 23S rRNA (pseudouridine(1915)-N(3))-methyltransferase RlmH, partial [Kordiimonadaceae bacterium]|nr:23S rRNA (pseudouridine(1915)-N(3))-methyltransferase RlmH [Kordiimonadaceae bacterium]
MNIGIIAVGRLKKSPESDLINTYLKRCPWKVEITEVEERRPITGAERIAREGDLILKAIPENAVVVALDERGKEVRSMDFAFKIRDWQDQGVSSIVFLIGGAEGYDERVKN